MRVFWEYMCDENHSWEVFRDEDATEDPQDLVCPLGHPAVVRTKRTPAKRWQIVIRPADRIVDSVTGRIGFDRQFYVCLESFGSETGAATRVPVEWSEAVKVADRVRQLSDDAALRYVKEYGRPKP